MSETPADKPADASASTPPAPPVSRATRWRRRIWRLTLLIVVLAFAMRVVVFFAVAPVMRKVAAAYGYDISFERQDVMVLGGDVGFWYLKVTPKSGGQPILQTDYVRGSISIIELFKGRLLVQRAEADGVDLTVERTADGRIPLLDEFLSATATQPRSGSTTTQPGQTPLDFTPPLKVEAFRLQHVRTTIRDAAVTPPFQATVAMDMRANSIGALDRPTRFDIDVWSDPLLDSMRISGEGRSDRQNLDLKATVSMRGLHPGPLAGYLAPFGIRAIATSIGADLSATIKTEPAGAGAVKAMLVLDRIRVTADEQETAALTKLELDADSVDLRSATIGNIAMNGGRIYSNRSNKGFLQLAGFELSGGQPGAHPAGPTTRQRTTSPKYAVSIHRIAINDMIASFVDQAVTPPNTIKASLTRLATTAQQIDPNDPEAVIPFEGDVSIPGIAQTMSLQGSAKPFAATKTADVKFGAQGIRLDAIKPYLAALGVEPLLEDAHAQGHMTATLRVDPATGIAADAQIDGLKLTQGADLITMGNVKIDGAGLDAKTGRLKLRTVVLSGPQIDVTRDSSGRIRASNFRWDPSIFKTSNAPQTARAPSTAPTTQAQAFNLAVLPRIEIESLTWNGLKVRLNDEQTPGTAPIAIEDAGLELKNFLFDLTSTGEPRQGTLKAWLNAPGLAKQVNVDGTIQSGPGSLDAAVQVRAQGLTTASLNPYLAPLGVESTLKYATAQADAKTSVSQTGEKLNAALDLKNVILQDAGTELGGVEALQVEGLSIDSNGVDIKAIRIQKPRAAVARESADVLAALGLRVKLPKSAPTTAPTEFSFRFPFVLTLHELNVTDGSLGWTDRTFATPVQTEGKASVDLSGLTLGKEGAPAKFKSVLSAPGVLDELIVEGTATPNPDSLALQANVQGKGIRAGALASYLPPEIQLGTKDGRVRATIDAGLARNPQGGVTARFSAQNVDWRDGDAGDPLLALDSFQATAPRIDMTGNVIAVDQLTLAGFAVQLNRAADGAITAAGVRLGATTTPAARSEPASDAPTTTPAQDLATLVNEARKPLPLLTLGKLDIAVRKITVQDLARPGSAPLAIENLQLKNNGTIELGGQDPGSRAPAKLEMSGSIAPVVGNFNVIASLSPFAQEPSAIIDLKTTGIKSAGVLDIIPELKQWIRDGQLTDGSFATKLETQLKFDRRGPRDFDLSRGFQISMTVNGVEFRDGEQVLAGLDSLTLEQARVVPKSGIVMAKSLEISKPRGSAFREPDGLHALGYVLPLPGLPGSAPTSQPSTAPEQAVAQTPQASSASEPPTPTTKPTGEIRIDRIVISGLDFQFEDRAVNPVFRAPLNGLELEVRDLTTLALSEPRMIRFAALLNADKVPIPISQKEQKPQGGPKFPIPFGQTATLASDETAAPTSRPTESRELFAQVATAGRVAVYPKFDGYAKVAVNGVELAAFEGLAAALGTDLRGGVFDGYIDAHAQDGGNLDAKLRLITTDLRLTEAAGGPIQTNLKLSAPLDAVIPLVEAPDGSINIPLKVTLKAGQISMGALIGEAAGALGGVLATAVLSAPIKVASPVTQLAGFGGFFGKKKAPEPIVIQFAPGSTYIEAEAQAHLNSLIELAKKDKNLQITIRHELGGGDVSVATIRANPSQDDALAMAQQIRLRRAALEDQRSQLASQLRGQLAVLPQAQSQATIQQLRSMEEQIAGYETSMDELYDLLRPGADLQGTRRARAASLKLAQERIDFVKGAVVEGLGTADKERIQAVSAQFNPLEGNEGGRLTVTAIIKGQGGESKK